MRNYRTGSRCVAVPERLRAASPRRLEAVRDSATSATFNLSLWHRRIALGELVDGQFEGTEFVISCLLTITDVDVIYTHATWLLKLNPKGVSIFMTSNANGINMFRPDEACHPLRHIVIELTCGRSLTFSSLIRKLV